MFASDFNTILITACRLGFALLTGIRGMLEKLALHNAAKYPSVDSIVHRNPILLFQSRGVVYEDLSALVSNLRQDYSVSKLKNKFTRTVWFAFTKVSVGSDPISDSLVSLFTITKDQQPPLVGNVKL